MTDIKLINNSENGQLGFDVAIINGDLQTDPGIETAILVSLFTDRRAESDDLLPSANMGRRGWWGDLYQGNTGRRVGSKLWLHSREKVTDQALATIRDEVDESLDWLIEYGLAMRTAVEVEAIRSNLVTPILGIDVKVYRRDGSVMAKNYQYMWSEQ
ncbi:MAG: phage GP46 family protein [Planctomycetota bacterium]